MSIKVMVASFLLMVLVAPAALSEELLPPKIMSVTYTQGSLNVKVSPVAGASSYQLEVSKDGVKQAVATSSELTLQIPASSLPANEIVSLRVASVNAQGSRSQLSSSLASNTPPPPPTGVKGTPGKNMIVVSWSPVPGAASYRISLSNGMSFTTTSTSYTFTGLPTATSYNCIVWASNAAGAQGMGSAPVSVKTANIMLD